LDSIFPPSTSSTQDNNANKEFKFPQYEARQDVFDYKAEETSDTSVEWWVNFADTNLFVAYGGSLFAQGNRTTP